MRKLLGLCFLLLIPVIASGQGVMTSPQVALQTVNGVSRPIPGATITVCAAGASGIPCAPVLVNQTFKDIALTQPLANPFTADANGNYQFAITAGNYTVTVTARGFVGQSYQLTLGVGGSGSPAFNLIQSGTNTSASMLCGTGCNITATGTGAVVGTGVTSPSANPASAGIVRLSNTDLLEFRNFANGANDTFGASNADLPLWNGAAWPGTAAFTNGLGTGYQDVTGITPPLNPASGNGRFFFNSNTNLEDCHTSTGASCLPSASLAGLTSSNPPASPGLTICSDAVPSWQPCTPGIPVDVVSSNSYGIGCTDRGRTKQYTGTTTGNWTLVSAASCGSSFDFTVKNQNPNALNLNITPTTSKINGNSGAFPISQGQVCYFQTDNVDYYASCSWITLAGDGSTIAIASAQYGGLISLATASMTVNTQTCTLGSSCTITPANIFSANYSAHQFLGNNTGSSTPPVASLIGVSDVSPNAYVAGGGTAQVQTATLAPAATLLTAGLEIRWLPLVANTGANPTLNVNGLGAKSVTKNGISNLVAGDLTTTAVADAIYDGSEWQLQNPQTSGGGTVSSVFGRTGAVVAAANDYTLDLIGGAAATATLNNTFPVIFNFAGSLSFTFGQTTAATSGANFSAPQVLYSGNYWTGSVSNQDVWQVYPALGASGSNPTSTFTFNHSSGSTGLAGFLFNTANGGPFNVTGTSASIYTFGLASYTTAVSNSPTFTLAGSYQNSGTPSFAEQSFGCQVVVGAGTNGTATLTCTPSGTTGAAGYEFDTVGVAAADGVLLIKNGSHSLTIDPDGTSNAQVFTFTDGATFSVPNTKTWTTTIGTTGQWILNMGTSGVISFNEGSTAANNNFTIGEGNATPTGTTLRTTKSSGSTNWSLLRGELTNYLGQTTSVSVGSVLAQNGQPIELGTPLASGSLTGNQSATTLWTTNASEPYAQGSYIAYIHILCTTAQATTTVSVTLAWNNGAAQSFTLIPQNNATGTDSCATTAEYDYVQPLYSAASQTIQVSTTAANFTTGNYKIFAYVVAQ